jgi:hypothetical protein
MNEVPPPTACAKLTFLVTAWRTGEVRSWRDEHQPDVVRHRAELAQIDETILVLARIASGRGRGPGRPPKWIKTVKRRGRPP